MSILLKIESNFYRNIKVIAMQMLRQCVFVGTCVIFFLFEWKENCIVCNCSILRNSNRRTQRLTKAPHCIVILCTWSGSHILVMTHKYSSHILMNMWLHTLLLFAVNCFKRPAWANKFRCLS